MTQGVPNTPASVTWPVIIVAMVALAGFAAGIVAFFGLKIASADSFISPDVLRSDYVLRVEVEKFYLPFAKLSADYLPKSDVEKNYLPINQVNNLYVPKAQYEQVQRQLADLTNKTSAIPSPLKPLIKQLTQTEIWKDERLGVSIRMDGHWGDTSGYKVHFYLATPDSPEHRETIDSNESLPFWTFRKNNREFKLSVRKVMPTTVVITEVDAAG